MKTALLSAVSREKTLFPPQARSDFIWAVVGSPWGLLAVWLVLINIITFFVFGADKLQAKRKEKKETGGSVGALLAMRVFRHKTLHKAFKFGVPLILALQILIPFGLWLYFSVIR